MVKSIYMNQLLDIVDVLAILMYIFRYFTIFLFDLAKKLSSS